MYINKIILLNKNGQHLSTMSDNRMLLITLTF